MNALELAELELKREGKKLTSKTFPLWLKRYYQIQNYYAKGQGNSKRR